MLQLTLPRSDGALARYALAHESSPFAGVAPGPFDRTVYAAAHVVASPLGACDPWDGPTPIDWDATLRFREHLFTGDDFNYGELIAGDGTHHSHGLLGIFDPIAAIAAKALQALAKGEVQDYRRMLDPTVVLSREIFRAPTRHYKAGVVFLAWLNGHQDHFTMVGGLHSARSVLHYARVFELADRCGALTQPALAVERMRRFLAVSAGIEG